MNRTIDHTLLKADASHKQIKTLCQEALDWKFASVCVMPSYVSLAYDLLQNQNDVVVCSVVGFPLGAHLTSSKVFETKQLIELGAKEIDMVINIGAVKSQNWTLVQEDIKAVVDTCSQKGVVSKVIVETCLLTEQEKLKLVESCLKVKATFIKTSTGMSSGGANLEDIALFKKYAGEGLKIKASGGIRDLIKAKIMIEAGADRIGTSNGVQIMKESLLT
jgi:deoxyribose-phosphate aldolase